MSATRDPFDVDTAAPGSGAARVAGPTQGPTKAFAEKMIADHGKMTSELKPLADKVHVSDQDKGHKAAVSLFERYGKGEEDPVLEDWASKILPDLQGHLKTAQDLDT